MARKGLVAVAAAVLLAVTAMAQNSRPRYSSQHGRSWTVPQGTVISMRMDSNLNSAHSRAGDRFSATVTIPVYVEGKAVIPAGATVEGRVTSVEPAKRRSKSGTIAVDFDYLVFPNGSKIKLTGSLTAADPRDRQRIDDESTVSGGDTDDRSAVFIGGGGAVGAIIGGIAGGGKGAVLGGIVGAGAGIAGVLLSKGVEAEVRPGTPFGIHLNQPLIVSENAIAEPGTTPVETRPPDSTPPSSSRPSVSRPPAATAEPALPLSSPEMIRRAQTALRDKGYYEGQIDGVFGPRTSTALRAYQREHKLAETGRLDPDTARSLGILGTASSSSSSGSAPEPDVVPATVLSATANRSTGGAVQVVIQTEANSGGWRWMADHSFRGDTIVVYAKAVRPTGYVTQAITRGKIELLIADGADARQVVVHSAGGEITLPLDAGVAAPPNTTSTTTSNIAGSADDLFSEYKRGLGTGSRLEDTEIAILFSLNAFATSADLYTALTASVSDPASRRAATLALAREARRTDRILMTSGNQPQSIITKWDAIRQEVLRLMESYNIKPHEIE